MSSVNYITTNGAGGGGEKERTLWILFSAGRILTICINYSYKVICPGELQTNKMIGPCPEKHTVSKIKLYTYPSTESCDCEEKLLANELF